MLDESDFQTKSDEALEDLYNALGEAAEHYGFEADFNGGALAVEFDDPPAKFVVSPNAPVRQIWVSAHFTSYKLDWDAARNTFAIPGGQTLKELMAEAVGRQLGETIRL